MTLRNLACSTASLLRLYRTALFQETSDIFSFLGNHVRYSRAAISTLPVDFRAQNVMEVSPTDTVTNNTSQHHLLAEVGVVGVPNAGKSTLTNCLVGKKVTAVSEKTNTTTRSRMGAFTVHNKQVILYDTPGVVGPEHYKNAKHAERVQSAWKTAFNCDIILFLIDAARQLQQPDPRVLRLVSNFGSQRAHDDSSNNDDSGNRSNSSRSIPSAILVLNKLDAIPKENRPSVLALTDQFRELASFEEVFWISALRSKGTEPLREYLLGTAKPGEWIVNENSSTDASQQEIAAEIVREKIFRSYYSEVPYEVLISHESFKILVDGSIRIEMNILVPTENVRMIVVGSDGAAIRSVGKAARLELEKMWEKRVHLFLNVKIAR